MARGDNTTMSEPSTTKKSIRSQIKKIGRDLGKSLLKPFKRSKALTATTKNKAKHNDDAVPPYRVVDLRDLQRNNSKRTACLPQGMTSGRALNTVTVITAENGRFENTSAEKNKANKCRALELWRPSPLQPLQRALCNGSSLAAAEPTNSTSGCNNHSLGLTHVPRWRRIPIPLINIDTVNNIAPRSNQALPKVTTASDASINPACAGGALVRTKLYTTTELVQMAINATVTQTEALAKKVAITRADPAFKITIIKINKDVLGGGHTAVALSSDPTSATRLFGAPNSSTHASSIPARLQSAGVAPQIEDSDKVEPVFFGPARPEDSDDSERESIASSNEDSHTTSPATTPPTSRPGTPEAKPSEELLALSPLPIYQGSGPHQIKRSYPPKQFFLAPELFDDEEVDMRRVWKLRQEERANMTTHEDPPEFLRGFIGENRSMLFQDSKLCPIGTCIHFEEPCYPVRKFLDLNQILKDAKVNIKKDKLHVAISMHGEVGIVGHPPYNEVEIYATKSIVVDVQQKNVEPLFYEYELNLEQHFIGCPVVLHTNLPIINMALDYRIQDIIAPRFESLIPPMLLHYINGQGNAIVQRAKASGLAISKYKAAGVLGQVVRFKIAPKARNSRGSDDNDISKWAMPLDSRDTGFETYGAGRGALMPLQPWTQDHQFDMNHQSFPDWISRPTANSGAYKWRQAHDPCGEPIDHPWLYCYQNGLEANMYQREKDDPRVADWEIARKQEIATSPDWKLEDHRWDFAAQTFVRRARNADGEYGDEEAENGGCPTLGYDIDSCVCGDDEDPRICGPCLFECGSWKANVPMVYDWLPEVEAYRADDSNEWKGEDNGVVEEIEDEPEAGKEADVAYEAHYQNELHAQIAALKTREEGGLIRFFPRWLHTNPRNEPKQLFLELNADGKDEVIAFAVSSTQNFKIGYYVQSRMLVLSADEPAMLAHFDRNSAESVFKTFDRAENELWWLPDLRAVGVECDLVCNLPVTEAVIIDAPEGAMAGPEHVNVARVKPGRRDFGRVDAWSEIDYSVFPRDDREDWSL